MRKIIFTSLILLLNFWSYSQDDIPIVGDFGEDTKTVDKTFPAIQIFNFQTTDVLPKGEMKLYIGHRMGEIGTGIDGLFGLFTANSRIGADLGLLKKLTIGIGSTSQLKIYNAYAKYRIIEQGNHNMPFTLSLMSDVSVSAIQSNYPDNENPIWRKMTYFSSLMLSRKFSERFSAQASFFIVHKNLVTNSKDKNTMYSGGIALNYKLNRIWYLASEYNYFPNNQVNSAKVSSHQFSIGVQIHSGPRHVFQIFLSNSSFLNEAEVLSQIPTYKNMSPKHLKICFNIPTTFKIF